MWILRHKDTIERERSALELIARQGCQSTFNKPGACTTDPARKRGGPDGISSWCDGCIAWDALHYKAGERARAGQG